MKPSRAGHPTITRYVPGATDNSHTIPSPVSTPIRPLTTVSRNSPSLACTANRTHGRVS